MRITVLTYVEEGEGSREYDAVVPQVAKALRAHGHDVSILGVHADVNRLIAGLRRRKPDLVFNLLEMFGDDLHADIDVAGLLELLGVPYTGCGPGEYYLSQDKALGKRLLAYENLLYPRFAVFSDEEGLETGGNLRMPLFVKPLRSDASIGIGADSLVTDAMTLLKRVQKIRTELKDASLAEEYIDGREFYVGVIGNAQPRALPPVEVDFTGYPRTSHACSAARRSGTSAARSSRERNRCWRTSPTSFAQSCSRWRWRPIVHSACATTAGWTCA
jgi:D-alanine-D-alanine ligase